MYPNFLLGAVLALELSVRALAVPAGALLNTTATGGRRCGSTPSVEHIVAAEAHFNQHKVTPEVAAGGATVIPVYFHVIYADTSCVSAHN